jgi:hypothetical protein
MSYNSDLQANNEELQAILNTVNALPNANSGGDSDVLVVTVSDNIASHSPAEIGEAYSEGKAVYLLTNRHVIPLSHYGDDVAYFNIPLNLSGTEPDNNLILRRHSVNADKSVSFSVLSRNLPPCPTDEDEGKVLTAKNGDFVWSEHSGGNVDLGVTGATVGQTVKISAVDENGVPTAWEATDFPSGGNGGAKMALLNVVEVTDADVLRIDVTETADGVPLADLGITKFVTYVAAAYGTKPDYTNYITEINGEDIKRNRAITESFNAQQRRTYHEFIGGGTVWFAYSEINGPAHTGTVGFMGKNDSSNWVPVTDFGEKLDSFSIYLYNGSFKVGTKIMLWGC